MHPPAEQAGTSPEPEPLARFMARAGTLPLHQGLALSAQLLAGIESLHRWGLVHAAISPQQVVVSRAGRLVVPGPGPRATHVLQRPTAYMPPEQDLGARPDVRGDLFAAAVVTYELLTGTLPFGPVGANDNWLGSRNASPRPVRSVRPGLPVALDAVFRRALARDPAHRYQTAAELLAAVTAAIPPPCWTRPAADTPVPAPEAAPVARVQPRGEDPVPVASGLAAPAVPRETEVHPAFSLGLGFAALAMLAVFVVGRPIPHPPAHLEPPQLQALAAADRDVPPLAVQHLVPFTAAAQEEAGAEPPPVDSGEELIEESPAPSQVVSPPARPQRHATKVAKPPAAVRAQNQAAAPNPEAACRRDRAPHLCAAFRCALPQFRPHPLCVQMVAEGARRLQLADAKGGP